VRTFPNNRGLPPKLLSTTRHLWLGDQSSASASLLDVCGYGGNPLDLVDFSAPAVCNAWGAAGGRVLDGSADYFATEDGGAADDFAEMQYAYVSTLISFRLGAAFSTAGCILSYGADTAAFAYSWDVSINANRNVVLRYGNGAAWITHTFTTPTLRLGRRYQIGLVRDTAANTVLLYVNGALVETKTSVTDVSVGAATLTWRVGCRLTTNPADFFNGEIYAARVDCSTVAAPTLADFREDFRRAQQWSTETACYYRAQIRNSADDAWLNMSSHCGADWFKGATISDDADQNMETCGLDLFRDCGELHLSRYHSNRCNLPDDYAAGAIGPTDTYYTDGREDTVAPNREMKIEVALVPLGSTPTTTDWQMLYHGKIGAVDWADDVKAECNDLAIDLMKAYIEHTTQFPTSHVDDSLLDTLQDMFDYAAAQSWVAASATIVEPVASGVDITTWKQERAPLFPTACGLPEQISWLLRYRWNDATGDFSPTLYQPDRTRAYEDGYITAEDYTAITTFKDDVADIRTRCRVLFASTAPGAAPSTSTEYGGWGSDSEGNAGQYYVECSGHDVDGTFDNEAGQRQFCELSEGSGVNITTYAQADKLASGIVRDLYKSTTQQGVKLRDGMPQIECEDMLYFAANNVHTTVDFLMAVYSRSISCSPSSSETTAMLRGKPSGGTKRWISREIRTSGARSGIMVKDDLNVAQASRISRQSKYDVFNRSGLVKNSDVAAVCNKQFQSATCGIGYAPDGWELVGGAVWNTDFAFDTQAANRVRGNYCLCVKADP